MEFHVVQYLGFLESICYADTMTTEYSYDNVLDSRNEEHKHHFRGVEIPYENWHVEVRRYPGSDVRYRIDLMNGPELQSGDVKYPEFFSDANTMIREGVARCLTTYQDRLDRLSRKSAVMTQIGF